MAVNEVVAMRHEPFTSVEEFLAPDVLSALVDAKIDSVRRLPFTGGSSASGSSFLAVETNDGQGPRFIVKLSSPACDWIVRGTEDEIGREVLVWSTGLLDRLPPEITHPVIACARNGEGWAILMHDVSDSLLPDPMGHTPIDPVDHRRILDALAALHAAFWERTQTVDPGLGFCSPWSRYTVFSPATGEREAAHPNPVARQISAGWELLWSLIELDIVEMLRRLVDDPQPLCTAQARYPQTLIHGDPRVANLGIMPEHEPRVVLIDWHLAGPGVSSVDLAWYLGDVGSKSPVGRETAIAWYRESLAQRLGNRFDESWWQPQLELSLLGELVRSGWSYAWHASHDPNAVIRDGMRHGLRWWSERAREGARWL